MSIPAATGAGWFKSSYSSSTGTCVEVRFDTGRVSIRDSKNRRDTAGDPILTISPAQWSALLSHADR